MLWLGACKGDRQGSVHVRQVQEDANESDNDKYEGDGDNGDNVDGDNGDDAAEAQFNMLYKQYRETGAIMVPELHFACIPFA
jgi:hypothetical protein